MNSVVAEYLAHAFGAVRTARRVGPATWLVDTVGGCVVVKQMTGERDPVEYAEMLRGVNARTPGAVPTFLGWCGASPAWFAVFRHVDGTVAPVPTAEVWRAAFARLRQFSAPSLPTGPCTLLPLWWARLRRIEDADPTARKVLHRLRGTVPQTPPVFAHGDFSPQNFCFTNEELTVLDLEEAGTAPLGYDAGWLLALGRVGAIGGATERLRAALDDFVPGEHLTWFEGLGLLRMLFRCRTSAAPYALLGLAGISVLGALRDYARDPLLQLDVGDVDDM